MRLRISPELRVPVFVAAAAAALFVAPVASAGAQNLLPNSSFDADFTGWNTGGTGSWALGADGASCELSHGADGQSALSGGGNQFLSLYGDVCLTIDPVALPELWLGALYRTSAPVYFRIYTMWFSDDGCNDFIQFSSAIAGLPTGGWNGLQGSRTVPENADSFLMLADFNPQESGIPAFTAHVDELYAGPEPPLFVNGFEAEDGSVCGWNSAQP